MITINTVLNAFIELLGPLFEVTTDFLDMLIISFSR